LVGARRPVGQHDRLRGSHYAPADRHLRRDAGRAFAAAEPGEGDARVARTALRGRARAPAGRAGSGAQRPGRHRCARGEDPHVQLSAGPCHRSPRRRQRAAAGRARRRSRAVHRSAHDGRAPSRPRAVSLGEVLRAAAEYLERKGVDSPRLDAELLLAQALGLSRLELYTQHNRPLSDDERAGARALVERRGRREPLAYILGEWAFRRLKLRTDARALVPRPETEIVVERAFALIEALAAPRLLDVGTGSGAIALAIASERTEARVTATDSSPDALALARENAQRLNLDVAFVQTNLLDGVSGPFDLVVSN